MKKKAVSDQLVESDSLKVDLPNALPIQKMSDVDI